MLRRIFNTAAGRRFRGAVCEPLEVRWLYAADLFAMPVYDLPVGARAHLSADFDRDGRVDIATTAFDGSGVSVVLNAGNGRFGAAASYPASGGGLAAADFNSDGAADLVTTASVLWNRGDGSFAPAAPHPGSGPGPQAVAAGDVNGDGRPDVLLAMANGTVSVVLNAGSGTFSPANSYAVDPAPNSVGVADLNGDGRLDVFTSHGSSNKVSVLLNNGVGFGAFSGYAVGGGPVAVLAADVNGDGRADLVSANRSSTSLTLLLNLGAGAFAGGLSFASGGTPSSVVATDLNGDGRTDLAAGNDEAGLSVLLNTGAVGSGTFGAPAGYGTGAKSAVYLSTADVDADGKADLIAAGADRGVAIAFGRGDGTLLAGAQLPASDSTFSALGTVAAVDLDGDGDLDLAAANDFTGGGIKVFKNLGGGVFAPVASYSGGEGSSLVAGDLNGDAKPDLVTYSQRNAHVHLNKGDGTFHPAVTYRGTYFSAAIAGGDLNGDGRTDVVSVTDSFAATSVAVMLSGPTGTLSAPVVYPLGVQPSSVVVADVDGDGRLDVATPNAQAHSIAVLRGAGDGTLGQPTFLSVGAAVTRLAVADLNADGRRDLIAGAASQSGVVSVLYATDFGLYLPPVAHDFGGQVVSVAAADVNGDGSQDLLATTTPYGGLGVPTRSVLATRLNLGGGAFEATRQFAFNARAAMAFPADLNGDGRLDVAAPVATDYASVAVLLNQGGGDAVARLAEGVLTLNSAAAGGRISLGGGGGSIFVGSRAGSFSFARANVTRILLNGSAGDDTLEYGQGVDAPLFFSGGAGRDTLHVSGGTLTLRPASFQGTENLSLTISGAAVTAPEPLQLDRLRLAGGGSLVLAAGGQTVLTMRSLEITGGRLDLTDNALVLDYSGDSPAGAVRALLVSARNGGLWDGPGIMTSAAATRPRSGIGYADAASLFSAFPASLGGQVVADGSTIVLRYTKDGDANLDGKLNAHDFFAIDRGAAFAGSGFTGGDFNYSGGPADADDYMIIDRAFMAEHAGGSPLAASFGAEPADNEGGAPQEPVWGASADPLA